MKYYYNKAVAFLVYRVNTETNTVACYGGGGAWINTKADAAFVAEYLDEITLAQAKKIYPSLVWLWFNLWYSIHMKKQNLQITIVIVLGILAILSAIGFSNYLINHSPRVEVTHGQGFKRVFGGHKLDNQTFAVPCQIGDFFRIAADNKTIITSFSPDSNGWAIIHFEYVN